MITSIWITYIILNILLQFLISKRLSGSYDHNKAFMIMKEKLGDKPFWDDQEVMIQCKDHSYVRKSVTLIANMWMLPIAILLSCLVIWFG